MKAARKHAIETGPEIAFDPERMGQRLQGSLKQAGVKDAGELEAALKGKGPARKKAERAVRRAKSDVVQPAIEAGMKGAALPPQAQLLRRAWRVVRVDAPAGAINREAAPAYVVRFEGNAPVLRLARAGVLGETQVLAAEKYAGLYETAMRSPRVTASYEAAGGAGSGGVAVRPFVDVTCDAWKLLLKAEEQLLAVERIVVREVVVYETAIEALARRPGLTPFTKQRKAEGAIVQALCSGLTRLCSHWGLDVGVPHDAHK